MQMVQRLLFGIRRPELRYTDLLRTEFASLLIVVLVLLALGLAPATLFAPAETSLGAAIIGASPTWNR
jgi:NADH-quinone oxidoreductase subunit M